MAVSHTSFDQRLQRINKAPNATAYCGPTASELKKAVVRSKSKSKSAKFTFPFFVGVGILTGGTAYAWSATSSEYQWVLAFAG